MDVEIVKKSKKEEPKKKVRTAEGDLCSGRKVPMTGGLIHLHCPTLPEDALLVCLSLLYQVGQGMTNYPPQLFLMIMGLEPL